MAPFFDVDLENISQVVEGGAGQPEGFLLFDRGRLGVALRDDDAAQDGAILAGYILPSRLALVPAEIYVAGFVPWLEEDAPAVFGHSHVSKLSPAVGFDAGGGAQVDLVIAGFIGSHVGPPTEEGGLPVFEGALQNAVAAQINVVRYFLCVIDHRGSPGLDCCWLGVVLCLNSFPI